MDPLSTGVRWQLAVFWSEFSQKPLFSHSTAVTWAIYLVSIILSAGGNFYYRRRDHASACSRLKLASSSLFSRKFFSPPLPNALISSLCELFTRPSKLQLRPNVIRTTTISSAEGRKQPFFGTQNSNNLRAVFNRIL